MTKARDTRKLNSISLNIDIDWPRKQKKKKALSLILKCNVTWKNLQQDNHGECVVDPNEQETSDMSCKFDDFRFLIEMLEAWE